MIALVALALVVAETPLAARSLDPEGWWKGRAYGRVTGNLRALASEVGGLGVDGILIQPMKLDAAGDVIDHLAIDPRAGTADDLRALVDAAHAANVAVLIALPINHVSREHPWFVAADGGDRLAQDAFVWSDSAASAERWTESKSGRWFYHAKSGADLDLRHKPTRARVMQAARSWIERGADGLVLGGVRGLFEDGPALLEDRPESFALVREIADSVRAGGAVIGADVEGDASVAVRYLPAASFALFSGRSGPLPPAGTRLVRSAASDAAEVLEGDPVFVDDASKGSKDHPRTADLAGALAARRASAALAWGVTTPLGAPAFARQLGRDRVVVARAKATLDLRGPGVKVETLFGGAPEPRGAKHALSAPGAWRVVDSDPAAFTVRFGRNQPPARTVYIDLGLRFDEARGIGFSRDVEASTRCSAKKCVIGDDGPPLRWQMVVPPGPYEVELDGEATFSAEGQPMGRLRKAAHAAVFVRDGVLTIEARDRGVEWSEIRIARAKYKTQMPVVTTANDRVVVRTDAPGVVEWRMNGSRVEPVERAPLAKKGASYEATLGPWPAGAVRDIAWVIKGEDGVFSTGEGGRELTLSIP